MTSQTKKIIKKQESKEVLGWTITVAQYARFDQDQWTNEWGWYYSKDVTITRTMPNGQVIYGEAVGKLDTPKNGATHYLAYTRKANMQVLLRQETAEAILAAIDELTAATNVGKPEPKKDDTKEAKIQAAKAIIAKAEEQKSPLMTNAARLVWERSYNNKYNEDKEGYVPHYVSREEYDAAKNIIAAA